MLQELEAVKQRLLQPISESQPCGEDPKYEDAYDELKQEIAKMGGMGSGSTDWNKVELGAIDLLEKSAKELNLLVYLVSAWTVNRKLPGMVVGFELVTGMLEQWWTGMFPPLKRIKPRKNAFTWLQERVTAELPKCKSEDVELLERALAALKSMKDAVYESFEDPPCNFRKVRDVFEEWRTQAPQNEPEPAPVEEVATPEPQTPQTIASQPAAPKPAPAAPARPAAPVDVPSLADDADAEQLLEVLAKIAGQLRPLAPQSSSSYQLLRIALWEGASEPGSNESRETFFPAPADEIANALKTMATRAAWSDLLERCEDLLNRWWYWLDLQRYAAQAAAGLQWTDLAAFIERETWKLDERLPNLKELKFNDGAPFASPETRDWLAGLDGGGGEGSGGGGDVDPGEALLSAMRLLGGDAFSDALNEAQTAIGQAPDRRSALQLRLAAAAFCMEADQPEWAASLLHGLIEEVEQHHLAWWEPRLAARVWRLMLETARALKEEEPEYREWERRAMRALAAFDLAQAGRFPKKKEPFA